MSMQVSMCEIHQMVISRGLTMSMVMWSNTVEMNIRSGEWGSGMAVDFVALALQILTGPFPNIRIYLRPNIVGHEQVLCMPG